jgi:hypothetical protein
MVDLLVNLGVQRRQGPPSRKVRQQFCGGERPLLGWGSGFPKVKRDFPRNRWHDLSIWSDATAASGRLASWPARHCTPLTCRAGNPKAFSWAALRAARGPSRRRRPRTVPEAPPADRPGGAAPGPFESGRPRTVPEAPLAARSRGAAGPRTRNSAGARRTAARKLRRGPAVVRQKTCSTTARVSCRMMVACTGISATLAPSEYTTKA